MDLSKLKPSELLKYLAKDTALYGSAKAFSLAVGFFTFPIIARHFSIVEYGLIDFISTVGAFLTTVIVFGQDSAVGRYFYEYTEVQKRRQLISQSFWVQFFACVLVCSSAALAMPLWSCMFLDFDNQELGFLMVLVLLQVPFNVLLSFAQNLLKWSFAQKSFLFVSLGSTVVSAGGIVCGILFFDFGIVSVFITYLATRLIFGLIGVYLCRQWIIWPRQYGYAREMLPFAIPLGVICVIASFVPLIERGLVNGLLGYEDLGLFAVGVKFASLISLPIAAFQTAWGPFSLAIHKESNAAVTYGIVLKIVTLILGFVVLMLSTFAEPLIRFLATDKYTIAAVVVLPISLGLMIQGVSWITEIGIGISKKAHLHLYAYGLYLLTTSLAIYILASVYGLVGVAWGTLLGYFFKAVASTYLAQKAYPLPWPLISMSVLIVLIALIGILTGLVMTNHTLFEAIVALFASVFFLITGAWWFLLNSYERSTLKRIIYENLKACRTKNK